MKPQSLMQPASICGMSSKMAQVAKPRKSTRAKHRHSEAQAQWPVWYQAESPLGSAVRYLASLNPKFNWVGIYLLKGKVLELGPFIGAETSHKRISVGQGICGLAVAENQDMNVPQVKGHSNYLACSLETQSELVVLIRNSKGQILGQIDIDSHSENAFGPNEEKVVRQVAKELGELWPE